MHVLVDVSGSGGMVEVVESPHSDVHACCAITMSQRHLGDPTHHRHFWKKHYVPEALDMRQVGGQIGVPHRGAAPRLRQRDNSPAIVGSNQRLSSPPAYMKHAVGSQCPEILPVCLAFYLGLSSVRIPKQSRSRGCGKERVQAKPGLRRISRISQEHPFGL